MPKSTNKREQVRQVFLKAGLLSIPTNQMQKMARQGTMNIEQVRAALDRGKGKSLSQIILEQRS